MAHGVSYHLLQHAPWLALERRESLGLYNVVGFVVAVASLHIKLRSMERVFLCFAQARAAIDG